MLKRGQVVQHSLIEGWVGVVEDVSETTIGLRWLNGESPDGMRWNERSSQAHVLIPIDGYEFEAALALGDTAKTLELYRDSQAALEPFAAYGKLKHPYADEAVFTIAYDREGNAVKILFSDFTRAAEVHPKAEANTHATATSGSAGGIAEIANDATVNAVLYGLDASGQLKADWQALRGEES